MKTDYTISHEDFGKLQRDLDIQCQFNASDEFSSPVYFMGRGKEGSSEAKFYHYYNASLKLITSTRHPLLRVFSFDGSEDKKIRHMLENINIPPIKLTKIPN
jgi:capsule polysaccharide export protein KpsE/RkpR